MPFFGLPVAEAQHYGAAKDIRRGTDSKAPVGTLIADRRNDQNLLLSQLHLALMPLHTKVIDALHPEKPDASTCFAEARRLVTQYCHWCLRHDFLTQILSDGFLKGRPIAQAVTRPHRETDAKGRFKLPFEFTAAAFRFGHSMACSSHDFDANFRQEAIVQKWEKLIDLVQSTTSKGMNGLGTDSQLPDIWVVDSNRLTDPVRAGKHLGDQIDLFFAGMMQNLVPELRLRHASIIFTAVSPLVRPLPPTTLKAMACRCCRVTISAWQSQT